MSNVTPPGFDMRNALDGEDLIWPWIVREEGKDTWGKVIVADREASMTMARYGLERSQIYDTATRYVRAQINAAVAWGTDLETWSIY